MTIKKSALGGTCECGRVIWSGQEVEVIQAPHGKFHKCLYCGSMNRYRATRDYVKEFYATGKTEFPEVL